LTDRTARSNYLIFLNVPEADSALPPGVKTNADKTEIVKLLEDTNTDNSNSVIRVHRLGVRKEGKCRPVKVIFESSDNANSLFARFFESVYDGCRNDEDVADYNYMKSINLYECILSYDEVMTGLLQLDIGKSPGPDGVPSDYLRGCASALVVPLTHIFNKSIALGIFPSLWKCGNTTPIFKKGDKSDITNYRPICLQNAMAKLLESLILRKMSPHINSVLDSQLHGFTPGKTIVTNLAIYEAYIADSLAGGKQVDSLYTDFSKAFDKVSHKHLIAKMKAFGISGCLLKWFRDYLSERRLTVNIQGVVSDGFVATSGLPQGSHFGPTLFLIFINDIVDVFKNVNVLLFADDIKIFGQVGCERDCDLLQDALDQLYRWCVENSLPLNIGKCQLMRFSRSRVRIDHVYQINAVNLESVTEIRDLGIVFDSGLSFRSHIAGVANRAMQTLGFVLRTVRGFRNVRTLVLLFTSLVRSILEFATPIWSPCYAIHINKLERVQKKFLRYINYVLGIPIDLIDYDCLRTHTNLAPLQDRRIFFDVIFLYKIINSVYDEPELLNKICIRIPTRTTRNTDTFHVDTHASNYIRNTVMPRVHILANRYLGSINVFNTFISLRNAIEGPRE
jgi:hypothetical protein